MYRKPIRRAVASNAEFPHSTISSPGHEIKKSRSTVYSVLWRKKTFKVHKTWEGDAEGILVSNASGGGHSLVVKAEGLNLGSIKLDLTKGGLEEGQILSSGRFEFEIGPLMAPSRSETAPSHKPSCVPAHSPENNSAQSSLMRSSSTKAATNVDNPEMKPSEISLQANAEQVTFSPDEVAKEDTKANAVASSVANRISGNKKRPPPSLGMAPYIGLSGKPLQLNPFIPLRPSSGSAKRLRYGQTSCPSTELQIDPALVEHLRPHQAEAVKFLYECVTGKKHVYGSGAILADEMGLGKSLTAITLIEALLTSGHIRHALVVCPVTLISNWRAEFRKWLPNSSQLGVLVVDQRGLGNGSLKDPVRAFFGDRSFKVHQVMIVGYERMRLIASKLNVEDKQFDLVVCDEGHKLKASGSKTAEAISSISGDKRILLTGTPIQNNLNEFWSLADFVNPGVFGSEAQFTKKYVLPIDTEDQHRSEASLDDLSAICDEFMLRRDTSVLAKYLSVPKTEYAVFCRPTAAQRQEYVALVSGASQLIDSGSAAFDQGAVLHAVTELKKAASGLRTHGGGKIAFLKELIIKIRQNSDEKMVIVSGSTKVLDLCQELCAELRVQWLRLDGQTPQERRQGMVDKFNKHPVDAAFVFLLSSRSGGMGLNLIGGSRLVLVDGDWNPSIDAQAMARIHRDGQNKACHIYRLLLAGTIDEKIFQRQLSKIGLSTNVLVESSGVSKRRMPQFTREQLRDLFSYSSPVTCNTIDMLPESDSLKGYSQCTSTEDDMLNSAMHASKNVSCVLVKK